MKQCQKNYTFHLPKMTVAVLIKGLCYLVVSQIMPQKEYPSSVVKKQFLLQYNHKIVNSYK